MKTIDYLREVYGYSVPIFLKDVRIGGKSKTSIRKELSRESQNGELRRVKNGIYYLEEKSDLPRTVSFEKIVERRFVKNDHELPGFDFDVYGYYTGYSLLNRIGLTQQIPAVIEVVTNNTSCKRYFKLDGRKALLRKPKIKINRFNYKALQFFDLFYYLNEEEIKENKEILSNYIRNNLSKADVENYLFLYPTKIVNLIIKEGLVYAFR